MKGMTTVVLVAAALVQGTAVSAKLPVIGFSAHPVTTSNADSNNARGQVSAVSVISSVTGPEVRIAVDPAVSFNHFTLQGPHRVVVDLAGAEVALRVRGY